MSISNALYRTLTNRDGAAGVEFALLLPALTLFLIGILDIGTLSYQSLQVEAAVHAGAQYALTNAPNPSLSGVTSAVTSATSLNISANPAPAQYYYCDAGGSLAQVASLTSTCSGGTVGVYIQVNAKAAFTPLIAWSPLSFPTTLSSQSVVRVQ